MRRTTLAVMSMTVFWGAPAPQSHGAASAAQAFTSSLQTGRVRIMGARDNVNQADYTLQWDGTRYQCQDKSGRRGFNTIRRVTQIHISKNGECAKLQSANLTYGSFEKANFRGAIISWGSMRESKLKEADFTAAELRNADFSGADLRYAKFSMASMREGDFSRANFKGAVLKGADMREAKVFGSLFQGADLTGVNLEATNLRDAQMFSANLQDANLREADMKGAHLGFANLAGADLQDTDLSQAELRGATLEGARFKRTNLKGAVYNRKTVLPRDWGFHGADDRGMIFTPDPQPDRD